MLFQNLDQPNSKPNVIMRNVEHVLQFTNLLYKQAFEDKEKTSKGLQLKLWLTSIPYSSISYNGNKNIFFGLYIQP